MANSSLFSMTCNAPEDARLVNFHELEQHAGHTFRWTEPVAMVRIAMLPQACEVILDTGSLRGANLDFPFQLHWNSHEIPSSSLVIESGKLKFSVEPSWCDIHGEQRLSISAKPLKAENGRRQLGMPVCSIEVITPGAVQQATIPFASARSKDIKSNVKGKKSGWFGHKSPEPLLPIWQVKMPGMEVAQEGGSRYPACDRVVIAPCEINARHGTGLLIQYLISDLGQVATVNSMRCYNDDRAHSRVHHYLPNHKMSRHQIYDQVYEWFGDAPPKQAYVVPYFQSDLYLSMALRDLFHTKIALHVMDDNCLFGQEIAIDVAEEAINKSDVLLVISPEMRQAYEQRFGRKAWVLPPIVPQNLIPDQLIMPQFSTASLNLSQQPAKRDWWRKLTQVFRRQEPAKATETDLPRGILIGNIWDRAWLEQLRKTIRDSGLQVDWYSNNPEAVWLKDSVKDLAADGIHLHDSLWGQALVDELRRRPFALMPSGQLTGEGSRESIARLSLPSRIPFVVSTSHLPVITLGSPETAAAKFVQRFELGDSIDYDGTALRQAVQMIVQPQHQLEIRQRAQRLSNSFSAHDLENWLWQSVDKQQPVDTRFEDLFPPKPGEFSCFFDAEPPTNVHWSFRDTWQMLNRIKRQGLAPDVIVDVGASTGVWSWTAATIFPDAKFVLVDPMMSRYSEQARNYYLQSFRSYELVEAALSDKCGQTEILVSNDLYGTSLLKVDERTRKCDVARVEVLTLDELARRKQLRGRTLIKIDVQYAEHLVVNGGLQFFKDNVDAVILELTIEREHPQAKTYREMLDMMSDLGFTMIDEMEGWRDPQTGRLEQKDTVFFKNHLVASRRVA